MSRVSVKTLKTHNNNIIMQTHQLSNCSTGRQFHHLYKKARVLVGAWAIHVGFTSDTSENFGFRVSISDHLCRFMMILFHITSNQVSHTGPQMTGIHENQTHTNNHLKCPGDRSTSKLLITQIVIVSKTKLNLDLFRIINKQNFVK